MSYGVYGWMQLKLDLIFCTGAIIDLFIWLGRFN